MHREIKAMNAPRLSSLLVVATLLTALGSGPLLAVESDNEAATKPAAFSYKVPLRGAPATRVGGGTRGTEAGSLSVNVLAPGETGFTVQGQPRIYWYLSARSEQPVEITIATSWPPEAAATPLLELTVPAPVDQGIHALDLAEHGITLQPDVEYQWFAAVVRNPDQRADDIVAGGTIQRIALPSDVAAELGRASGAERAAVYARGGIWYDAIEQLSESIASTPDSQSLRAARASLLDQVGLESAAEYDRSGS